MKLKAFIAILLGVLVLATPLVTYANISLAPSSEMSCCGNTGAEKDCNCDNDNSDRKDCCGSKSHCNCMISVVCSAFIEQDSPWTPSNNVAFDDYQFDMFSAQKPSSISIAIWQPPKFLL